MPRNKGRSKKKPAAAGQPWGTIRLGGFSAVFPKPSLPRLLGTNNLAAGVSTYPRVYLDLPIVPTSIAISSGAVSTYINIATALIDNWSGYSAVFASFTILGARFEARITVAASGQGVVCLGVSDNSTGAALGSNTLVIPHIELPIPASVVNQPAVQRIEWICRTPSDLEFYPVTSSQASTSLQAYAATATTFTGASTSATLVITGTLRVCFQGFV